MISRLGMLNLNIWSYEVPSCTGGLECSFTGKFRLLTGISILRMTEDKFLSYNWKQYKHIIWFLVNMSTNPRKSFCKGYRWYLCNVPMDMGILVKIRLVNEWKNQDFNLNTVRNRKHCLTPSGKQYSTILIRIWKAGLTSRAFT